MDPESTAQQCELPILPVIATISGCLLAESQFGFNEAPSLLHEDVVPERDNALTDTLVPTSPAEFLAEKRDVPTRLRTADLKSVAFDAFFSPR